MRAFAASMYSRASLLLSHRRTLVSIVSAWPKSRSTERIEQGSIALRFTLPVHDCGDKVEVCDHVEIVAGVLTRPFVEQVVVSLAHRIEAQRHYGIGRQINPVSLGIIAGSAVGVRRAQHQRLGYEGEATFG